MGEGGGGVNVTIDVNDLYTNVTNDVSGWYSSEATTKLVDNAFVMPRGITDPSQLTGWSNEYKHLWDPRTWTGRLSDTRIQTGVTWYWGGNHQGQGRYICYADVYFVINEIGSFEKFHVAANLNPLGQDGVARLVGEVTVKYYEWGSLSASLRYNMDIRGDGSGSFQRI